MTESISGIEIIKMEVIRILNFLFWVLFPRLHEKRLENFVRNTVKVLLELVDLFRNKDDIPSYLNLFNQLNISKNV